MIELKDFAREIAQGLNMNNRGINFAVFTDAGKYEEAKKTHTEKKKYTNCLLMAGASSIVPTQGVTVATQRATLEVCVQLLHPDMDDEIIAAHRDILDAYFTQVRVDTMTETDSVPAKKYAVTAVYSFASTGTAEFRDRAGTSLTFVIYADWTYVENGLNSLNCTFTLDGKSIPYSTARITKSSQMQSDVFSNDNGRATSVAVSFVRSFDFEMPAQQTQDMNGIGELIISHMLGDTLNTPHQLTVKLGNMPEVTYKVIFAETSISLEGVNNGGHIFSLVEYIDSGAMI